MWVNLWRRFVKFRIMCSTIFKRRRHSLFTLLLKIVRIWFIFTWNVHCNRIVAFIPKFIIHELKLVVNILLLLFIFTAVKMKVYVIWKQRALFSRLQSKKNKSTITKNVTFVYNSICIELWLAFVCCCECVCAFCFLDRIWPNLIKLKYSSHISVTSLALARISHCQLTRSLSTLSCICIDSKFQ